MRLRNWVGNWWRDIAWLAALGALLLVAQSALPAQALADNLLTTGSAAQVEESAAENGQDLIANSPLPGSAETQETDYEDYGWLYRENDYWWDKTTPRELVGDGIEKYNPKFALYSDGLIYEYTKTVLQPGIGAIPADYQGIVEMCYTDGEVVYQRGHHVSINKVVDTGFPAYTGAYMQWFYSDPRTINPHSVNEMFASPNADCRFIGLIRTTNYNYLPYLAAGRRAIKRVVFEDSLTTLPDSPKTNLSADGEALLPTYADGWFKGLSNLTEISGFENVDMCNTKSMADMFSGCISLKSLDLTSFDTMACEDFSGMFDGCEALEMLAFGAGWTQAAAGENAATFPLDMVSGEGDDKRAYHAGDVIPDGAAVYTVDRISISAGKAKLMPPGWTAVSEEAYEGYLSGEAPLPAGAVPSRLFVLGRDKIEDLPEQVTYDYSGSALEPKALLYLDGAWLQEGVDFKVEYQYNVNAGTGQVILVGINDYYGSIVCSFGIQDKAAYAFLYSDGLLVLKCGSSLPSTWISGSSSYDGLKKMRWFGTETATPGSQVPWASEAASIKRVVFDYSFDQLRPASCAGWFKGCTQLEAVSDMQYINGAQIESAAEMFADCASLVSFDLTKLDVSAVRDFTGMFSGCHALERVCLGNSAAQKDAVFTGFFEGCSNLAEVSASNGWSNATTSEEPLVFPSRAYRINSIYQCFEEGFPVPAGLGTYRLRGIPMQNAVVMMDPQPLSYSGKALKPKMDIVFGGITLQEGVDYTISLSANVLPGTAMATVTGMGAFTGSLLVPFKIVGTTTKVGDRLLYKAESTTYTFAVTKVNQGGLNTSVSAKLVGVVVGSAKVTTLSIPSECTINGIRVDVTAVGTKLGGTFKNVRTVVIGAKVVTIAARAFASTPKVKSLIVKSARLKSVKNCLKGSKVSRVTTRVWLSKSQRSKYKKWFTKKSGKTGVKFVYG